MRFTVWNVFLQWIIDFNIVIVINGHLYSRQKQHLLFSDIDIVDFTDLDVTSFYT